MMFKSQITTKQKKIFAIILGVLLLLGLAFLIAQKRTPAPALKTSLSQEDLAALTKPAVVRIIQHTTGELTVPQLNLDLTALKVSVAKDQAPQTYKIDRYGAGSGFVVNPNGYILTNAHVISGQSIKQMYLEDLLIKTLEKDPAWAKYKDATDSEGALVEFLKSSLKLLDQASEFKAETKITVLNPSSSKEYLENLLADGYKAEIISYDENFRESDKDVALIKIDAKNLPTLSLGDDSVVATGHQIFVFGFPSTAEINQKNPLESTFTGGLISALKFSETKDFKIFLTDAKISQGSSGGPLLNSQGQVIGLITFQTGENDRTAGDNFAFALPVRLAKNLLQQNQVANEQGSYPGHFAQGLSLLSAKQCEKANAEFRAASRVNSDFSVDKYINPYVKRCDGLILAGQSLDNQWQRLVFWFESLSGLAWFVVAGRVFLAVLAAGIFWLLFKKLSRDEQEIGKLSAELEQEKKEQDELLKQLSKRGVELPLPDADELHAQERLKLNIPHPHIVDFVKEARQVGLKDEHISQELTKAGWSEQEIRHALDHGESSV